MRNVLAVARKEFRDDFRSRWTLAVTVIFAALALGIAYFGAVASGRVGFTSFTATVASLTTLAAFVIPLIGLLIAHDTLVGEQEGGTLLLLLSSPLLAACALLIKVDSPGPVLFRQRRIGRAHLPLLVLAIDAARDGAQHVLRRTHPHEIARLVLG